MRVSDANRPHGQWPGHQGYGPVQQGTMPMNYGPPGRRQTPPRPPAQQPRPAGPPSPPQPRQERQGRVLKALGLVAVAVVSGMLWWLIQQNRNQPPPETQASSDQRAAGVYTFVPHPDVPKPRIDSACADHAYDAVQKFLKTNRCEVMERALFTTTVEGKQIYTSVAVVRMTNQGDAKTLKGMVDNDGTGNINDLVKERAVKISGLSNLANGGYDSALHDTDVIIVESDFPSGGKKHTDEDTDLLTKVSKDAIRLGDDIRNNNQR